MKMKSPLMIAGLFLGMAVDAVAITRITQVEFAGKTAPHQILITGDGPIEFEKIDNTVDKQIILELKNAKLANSNVGRRIDASSFNSKVILISPYNVESENAVRIIVQLRDNAESPTVSAGNKLFVGIDGEPDAGVVAAVTEAEGSMAAPVTTTAETVSPATPEPETIENYGDASGKGRDGTTVEDRLEQAVTARETKKYMGSRITIQVKEAAISDVFRLIGEASGFNIIMGADVTGNITLSLVDVPWDLALDTVLSTMRLGAERRGNVLRVATLATLTQEKQVELTAKRAAEASAPRVTRIIPISYADPAKLIPILQKFGGGSAGNTEGTRDTIMLDDRTNSLVIQDIPENIDRMAKMIDILDKPTPQILIESKIIEATEELASGIVGSLGVAKAGSLTEYGGASFSNGTLAEITSSPFPDQTTGLGAKDSFFSAGFSIARISGSRLRALLTFSESESKGKIISSPRTLVLNRQTANIVQGTPVLVPVTILDSQTGLARISNTVQQANLSLQVKPTVTNDGNVIMDLQVSSDEPKELGELSGIGNRNIRTQVVAESGNTIVVGGAYKDRSSQTEGGYPGLRKIPIIGRLFGYETNQNQRVELLIFVTPKIVNEREIMQESEKSAPSLTTDQG